MTAETDEWLTVSEFAEQAGINKSTIYQYRTYNINGFRDQTRKENETVQVHRDALERWQD